MFDAPFHMAGDSADRSWKKFLLKNGYSRAGAESAAPKLEKMDPRLMEALLRWDRVGELPDFPVQGFTAQELMEHLGLHPIAAILMLDWLLREPEAAKSAIANSGDRLMISPELCRKLARTEEEDQPDHN